MWRFLSEFNAPHDQVEECLKLTEDEYKLLFLVPDIRYKSRDRTIQI
jgi:hypothetical protein